MKQTKQVDIKDFQLRLFPRLKDFNIGIILIGVYYIFEFGSIQGLNPFVNNLRLPLILAIATLLYAIILLITKRVNFNSNLTKIYTVLIVYLIADSSFRTIDPIVKTDIIKGFILYWAYYIIISSTIKTIQQQILLLDFLLASFAYSSLHGIVQGGLVWGNKWLRDQNHISLVAAMLIPFSFYAYSFCKNKIKKLCYLTCIILYTTVNVIAASRGGGICLLLAFILIYKETKKKFRNLLIISILGFISIAFVPKVFIDEMMSLKEGTEASGGKHRTYLYGLAFKVFKDNIIFGVGPMNHPIYMAKKGNTYDNVRESIQVVHSTPMQWLAEGGIVGLVMLILLQIQLFKNFKKSKLYIKRVKDDAIIQYVINLAKSSGYSQLIFWVGSFFLSLLPYPFYWNIIPYSECASNYLIRTENQEIKSLPGEN